MKAGLVHALLLVLAVLVVFGAARSFGFLSWDDTINVTANPLVLGARAEGLARAWAESYAGLYVPVAYTWYWLLAKLSGAGGPDAALFHAANLVLHAIAACLTYRLLARLVANPRAACVGALVFVVHPLVVESVAWVTEARGLLAATLSLAALDLALASVEPAARATRAVLRAGLATLAFAAALLAKPQAAALPLTLLILAFVLARRDARAGTWRRVLPLAALWALGAAGALLLTKSLQADDSLREVAPLWARPIVALDALGFYACKVIAPVGLTADYGRTPQFLLDSLGRAWPALVFLALAGACATLRPCRRFLVVIALFVAALLPVSGLVPFAYQDVSTVADRYAYPALLALALLVALALERSARATCWTVAALACIPLATLCLRQSDTWRDDRALFARVLEVNPRSWKAYSNLGLAEARAGRLDAAVANYRKSLEVGPSRWIVHQNLGLVLAQQKQYAQAEIELARSLELRRDNLDVATTLGAVRLAQGRFAEAEGPLRAALALDPERADALENLGTALLALGRDDEAITCLRAALARRDSPEAHKNLAQALVMRADVRGAITALESALKARPDWPEARSELAWLLATADDDTLRDGPRAFELISAVLTATRSPSILQVDTLAAAQAAVGRYEDAVHTLDELLRALGQSDPKIDASLRTRREAYAQRRAWRGVAR